MRKMITPGGSLLVAFLGISCISNSAEYTKAGIQSPERAVLEKYYFRSPNLETSGISTSELHRLFLKSLDPSLDGERSESCTSALVTGLFEAGDRQFSEALGKERKTVQAEVLQRISPVWTLHHLSFPRTRSLG